MLPGPFPFARTGTALPAGQAFTAPLESPSIR